MMMHTSKDGSISPWVYYAGIVLLVASIAGGASTQGLWSTHLIEMVLLPAVFVGLAFVFQRGLETEIKVLVLASLGLVALQFMPWLSTIDIVGYAGPSMHTVFWSAAPGKALEAGLLFVCALGFALLVARFSEKEQKHLLFFVFAAFLVSVIIAVSILSFGGNRELSGILPYTVRMGIFANENHFATFSYALIPLLAYLLLIERWLPLVYGSVVALLLLILFAVNSSSGMLFSLAMTIIAPLWLMVSPLAAIGLVAVGAIALGAVIVLAPSAIPGITLTSIDQRLTFYKNTWAAIGDHLFGGAGLGSFTLVYPTYQQRDELIFNYVNHAHNDYLELWLELGLPGLVLVMLFLVLLSYYGHLSKFRNAAFLCASAMLIHSLLDYPLRTPMLALVFAFACGVVFSPLTKKRRVRISEPVSERGRARYHRRRA